MLQTGCALEAIDVLAFLRTGAAGLPSGSAARPCLLAGLRVRLVECSAGPSLGAASLSACISAFCSTATVRGHLLTGRRADSTSVAGRETQSGRGAHEPEPVLAGQLAQVAFAIASHQP